MAEALLRHELSQTTSFDKERQRFVRGVGTCPGLLPVLARAFRFRDHGPGDCPRCLGGATSKRATLGERARAAVTPTAKRRRRGQFVPISPSDVPSEVLGARAGLFWCRGATDADHGSMIDDNVTNYLSQGPVALTDPCARALMQHVTETLGWLPVASQVPLYSPSLRVATAIDLVCTDRATRRRLYLLEIKATRTRSASPELLDACYKATAAAATPVCKTLDLPSSRYMQHQLQLWAMHHMVTTDCGLAVDEAVVIRVGPGFVAMYPLHAALVAADASLAGAVAIAQQQRKSK